jgi:DNA-directed RNA polymerase specialized sigma24 family protein
VSDFTGALAERDRIMAALTDLPLEQRAVIVLHFYLDLSMVQAAAVLDVPVGTAKSRLNRGLEALRMSLGEEPELFEATIRERPT